MHNKQELHDQGFERVERDDRLLDVFKYETPEKGVELWIKWENSEEVEIVRFHDGKETRHALSKDLIEQALLKGRILELNL